MAMPAAFLAFVLAVSAAPAASAAARHKPAKRDPRTSGLGHSCRQSKDCRKGQRCLRMNDVNGKPEAQGFCVLPCAAIDAGTTKVVPGAPLAATPKNAKEHKVPPRCPPKYQCRDKGQGVPIDMCVKE
jgi:uncharacterized membrane protein